MPFALYPLQGTEGVQGAQGGTPEGVPGALTGAARPEPHAAIFSVVRGGPSGSPERRLYHPEQWPVASDQWQAAGVSRSLTTDY